MKAETIQTKTLRKDMHRDYCEDLCANSMCFQPDSHPTNVASSNSSVTAKINVRGSWRRREYVTTSLLSPAHLYCIYTFC